MLNEGKMSVPTQILPAGFFSYDSVHYRAYHVIPAPSIIVAITCYLFFRNITSGEMK
jgi:hypothetical protein